MKVDCLVGADFLVDRWVRGAASAAEVWLEANGGRQIGICWIAKAQLLGGARSAGLELKQVADVLERYPTHWPDDELLKIHADVFAHLKRGGLRIRPNDLWTASSALRLDVPLLTRSFETFERVPGLRVERY